MTVPTTFHIRATDARNPANVAQVAILVRPNLTLSTLTPTLFGNGRAVIRMLRGQEEVWEPAEGHPSPFIWDVVKHWIVPHGEAVQRKLSEPELEEVLNTTPDRRTRFIPPEVDVPTRFVVEMREETQTGDLATLDFLVQPAILIQPLNRLKQTLLAGDQVQFRARRGDDRQGAWVWTVTNGNATIHALDGLVTFTAPPVAEATTFELAATDERDGLCGTVEVHVLPQLPGMPRVIADTLMTTHMGQNWMNPVPSMYPFAGAVAPLAQGLAPVFQGINAMAFVDDPALAGLHLHKKWVVADQSGLQVLPYLGKTATPLAGARGRVTALAVRPRTALEANPRHVVFALAQEPAAIRGAQLHLGMGGPGACVLSLDPTGAIQLLAGTLTDNPQEVALEDGPGPAARFGAICGLAMDRDGTVYVADAGNRLIRRIGPDGLVETLAGNAAAYGTPQDGVGAEATFRDLNSLTLDPVTRNLYVVDGPRVRQVTRAGAVTTLLTLDKRLTGLYPSGQVGLACHGDHLLMALEAGHVVAILNLKTRTFGILAGSPEEKVTRMGPLEWFSPGLETWSCAALAQPRAVATNADGMCVVGLNGGLVQLDLHTLDHLAGARQFKRKARPPAAAAALAPAPPAAPAGVAAPAGAAAAAGRHGKRKAEEEGAGAMEPSAAPASAASSSPDQPRHKRANTEGPS